MNFGKNNEPNTTGTSQCPLIQSNCEALTLRHECSQHLNNENRSKINDTAANLEQKEDDNALINSKIMLYRASESSDDSTELGCQTSQPSTAANLASNVPTELDPIFNNDFLSGRQTILQRDRTSNSATSLHLNQTHLNSNSNILQILDDQQNEGMPAESEEEQMNRQAHQIWDSLSELELEFASVSINGFVVHHVHDISRKMSGTAFIDLPQFRLSEDGPRFWVRLYPRMNHNGSVCMSIYLYLNTPFRRCFRGTIEFILLNQTTSSSSQHYMRSCSGEILEVNGCLGLDEFFSYDWIHQANNPCVRNGSICVKVRIREH